MALKPKTILVTGAAGFIGSTLARLALEQGRRVVAVDKLTYAGDLRRLADIRRRITFYKADILSEDKLRQMIKKERPWGLVHAAAESHVDKSIVHDFDFARTNVLGTRSVLAVCKDAGIEKFIHVSTDEVYGESAGGVLRESAPLRPSSPYAASKAAAEHFVAAYIRTYGFPAIIVRPCNNYGPWQHTEKFIPKVLARAMGAQSVPVYARGLNVREWLHVADCAGGILKILDKGRGAEVYNLGSGLRLKNIEVARSILKLLGKPERLLAFVPDRPGHDFRYALDSSKVMAHCSWRPKITWAEGLASTAAWYRQHQGWAHRQNA